MGGKFDLRQIQEKPELATITVSLFNEPVTFRPLMASDTKLLTVFLTNLSAEIRSEWKPHDFDRRTAKKICAAVATESGFRLIAVKQEPENTGIKFWKRKKKLLIGYFIFSKEIKEYATRYADYGIRLSQTDWLLAPCVADKYQGYGLGSLMLKHLISIAHHLNVRRILLLGGVVASNGPAIALYRKFNFRIAGEHMAFPKLNKGVGKTLLKYYDMILELSNDSLGDTVKV
jgi:ribosomal protein S18 acetylase RimI-like enzyme